MVKRSAAVVVCASLALIAVPGAAAAAPPIRYDDPIDRPLAPDKELTARCGVPVQTSVTGNSVFRRMPEGSRSPLDVFNTTHAVVTATGPGGSVKWGVGFVMKVFDGQGGERLTFSGRLGFFDLNGHVVIDPNAPEEEAILHFTGGEFGFDRLCAALT